MIRSADGSVLARAQTAPARTKRGSALLVTLLVSALLVLVPAAPAGAIQTISWVVPPPGTANLGDQFSFTWTGRADTFLGARITGCFANFLDGNNYSRSFGGNFTTGSCTVSGRTVTTSPTYPITAGFTLSTGGQMTMGWNISVQSPTPTVVTSGNQTVAATSVAGAPVTYSAYGTDNTYGTYGATCIPQSGYTFAPGTSTVQCQATNPAGKTGYAQLQVTVTKATPTIAWNPPASIVAGTTFESLMSATAQAADATGSFTYSDVNGNSLNAGSILPVGDGQQIQATWAPSTQASAAAFTSTSTWRTVDVTRRPQSVQFVDAPTSKAYGDAPFTVVAAGTAGGAAVLVSTLPGSACSVAQHSYSSTVQATVTITGVGPCVLSAFQIQDGPWAVSPTVQHSVTVAKGTPELTVTPTVGGTHGARWGDLLAVASNVPGSFEYFVNGDPVSPNDLADVGTSLVHVQLTPFDQTRYTHAIASTQLTVVPAVATLDVTPASGDRTYGDAPIQLTSTTNSPGAVVHSVTGPCSVAGSIVTILGAGTCTTTSQVPATGTFTASPLVTRTFTIAKATPTVTWATPEAIAYGTPLDAAQLNAVVSADLADPGASLPLGSYVYTPAEGTVLDAGTHLLHVTFVPFETESTRWNAKAAVVELTVSPANPVITWDAPSGITYGTPLGADQLDASATSAGTFEYSPAAGTVLGAGDHSLNVLFTSTDPNYLSGMTGVPLTVTKAAQAIDFEITGIHTYGDAPFGVSATGGGSGNPVTFAAVPGSICAVVGTTVTITGAGPCVIAASQAGDDDHLPAPTVTRSATVDPAVPTIAWDAPEAITHGTALGATQLDASIVEGDATGAIRYFLADGVTPADGVVLHAGDDQVLTAVFEPDAQGSANYVPTAATVTIDVAQATQTITFDELAPVTFGDAPFAIAATGGGSGLPVTFAATGDGCTVNGTTVTVAHAGTCTITASQAGNDDFLPATDVSQVLAVAKAGQTIELGAIADHTFGDAPFTGDDDAPGVTSTVNGASGGACSVS
ncbi:MAG TPA: hypothetical protein VEA78_09470, partial [Acidimicrobiales bacterium]|nr:hypothetical protein [Acidimicrobiales bacterium]